MIELGGKDILFNSRRHQYGGNSNTGRGEIETVALAGVRWFKTFYVRRVIVKASVLVKENDQQGLLPQLGVCSDSIIHISYEGFRRQHIMRRMVVVLSWRHIRRLDQGEFGKSIWIFSGGVPIKLWHMMIVRNVVRFPLMDEQERQSEISIVDLPFMPFLVQAIENSRLIVPMEIPVEQPFGHSHSPKRSAT